MGTQITNLAIGLTTIMLVACNAMLTDVQYQSTYNNGLDTASSGDTEATNPSDTGVDLNIPPLGIYKLGPYQFNPSTNRFSSPPFVGYSWYTPIGDVVVNDLTGVGPGGPTPFCLAGQILPWNDTTTSRLAAGFYLNQSTLTNPPATVGIADTNIDGIYIDYDETEGLNTVVAGISTLDHNYCATQVPPGGTAIEWSAFLTNCGASDQEPSYDGQPLQSASLSLVNDTTEPAPYRLCFNELTPFIYWKFEPEQDGSFTIGPWSGGIWTAATAGATIVPNTSITSGWPTFVPGDPICAEGIAAASWDSIGMLGFSLSQPDLTDSATSVTPTGEGLFVNFTHQGDARIQISINGPDAETDPNQRWCIEPATDGPQTIPWNNFSTECWGTGGVAYNGESISAIIFTAPGESEGERSFSYCISDLRPYF